MLMRNGLSLLKKRELTFRLFTSSRSHRLNERLTLIRWSARCFRKARQVFSACVYRCRLPKLFHELNRNRFDYNGIDFVIYPVNPQAHSIDTVTSRSLRIFPHRRMQRRAPTLSPTTESVSGGPLTDQAALLILMPNPRRMKNRARNFRTRDNRRRVRRLDAGMCVASHGRRS